MCLYLSVPVSVSESCKWCVFVSMSVLCDALHRDTLAHDLSVDCATVRVLYFVRVAQAGEAALHHRAEMCFDDMLHDYTHTHTHTLTLFRLTAR